MSESTIAPQHGQPPSAPQPGDLNDQLIGSDFWTEQMLVDAGIPIIDVPFVTVGGGIGSFVTVDYLRICGVPTDAIRVLSTRFRTRPVFEDTREEVRRLQEELKQLQRSQDKADSDTKAIQATQQYLTKLETFTTASTT